MFTKGIFISTNLTLKIFENPKLTHEETFQKELRYTLTNNKIETILIKQIKLEQNWHYELHKNYQIFYRLIHDIIIPISIINDMIM